MKLGSPSKKVQRQTHIVNCIAMNRPFAQPRSHADRSRQGVSEAETMSGVEEVYQTLKSLSYSFFLSFTHSVMFFLKLDKLFRCLIFVLVFDYTQNTQVFFRWSILETCCLKLVVWSFVKAKFVFVIPKNKFIKTYLLNFWKKSCRKFFKCFEDIIREWLIRIWNQLSINIVSLGNCLLK